MKEFLKLCEILTGLVGGGGGHCDCCFSSAIQEAKSKVRPGSVWREY